MITPIDRERLGSATSAHEVTGRVFEHHLGAFAEGLAAVMSDYDGASILVTPERIYRGLDEIRDFFQMFMGGATPEFWEAFTIRAKVVEGEVAYLVWDSQPQVALATDTLVVRNGKIAVHTFTSN
ncbi:nuclear transport factor 2 family protein [Sphingopyxis indica]|uniref:nuclear transport factor 2 family protein n=1 Tax=Sphingopyxis indica TaxID=436663 RepID=UPI002938D897|nr:nuclear transport factor 2 family protein [Sphingopyxis indica]WOF44741.1 nuclear transport factor 2 family protein [Sphingopyxis indica]